MHITRFWTLLLAGGLAATTFAACDSGPSEEELAPESASLEPAEAATEMSKKLVIDTASSKTDFLMEAPLEHIHGKAPGAMKGELFVDYTDITESNGLVKVDLGELEVFQQKRESEDEELGEEAKNEKQNAHMRTWLQISDDAPAEVREDNRWLDFKITKVSNASQKNILEMDGAERSVTADVTGDLRLHGRKTTKTAKAKLTFTFDGDQPTGLEVESVEPLMVGLAEHDVRPRSAFDKLAQKGLAALGQKVAEAAPVHFSFEAAVEGDGTAAAQ